MEKSMDFKTPNRCWVCGWGVGVGGKTCLLKSYKLFFLGPVGKMEPTCDEVWHIFCIDSVLG